MIEAYAFLAAFTVQILVMSVLLSGLVHQVRSSAGDELPRRTPRAAVPGCRPRSCSRALSDSIPRAEHGHRSARLVAAGLAVQLHAAPGLG